jgi:hypothetical protein
MSSWDSYYQTEQRLKIKGTDQTYPISHRYVYDTPHYVSLSLITFYDDQPVTLKSWSRESEKIDVRSMDDSDVHDLFSSNVEKAMEKFTTVGLTERAWKKMLKDEGLI